MDHDPLEQLDLIGRHPGRGLFGGQFDHRGVLRESECGECVRMVLDLRADCAKQVGAGLQHRVFEILAQEVRIAARNRFACIDR